MIDHDPFKPIFKLAEPVRITISGERGMVVATARYLRVNQPSYLVEYKAADGRAIEGWFYEDQIEPDPASAKAPPPSHNI